jgi:alpha-glucosidase (family GH31 glycosyl hydrolase)
MIMNKNTIFILRAKFLGFAADNKKKFCFSPKILTAPVVHPASRSVSTQSPLHRVHWQERVSDHLFSPSAEILTVCSNTVT